MKRGVEARGDNLGWLTVANRGKGGSEVVVHLSFGERSVELEMQERAPEGCDPPGGGHLGDAGVHSQADRGGLA
jgi:hypothetical protein